MKLILTFIAAVLVSTMASAAPITFVYTGTLSTETTLNGVDVGNQSFVFTATADNSNVFVRSSDILELLHDTATIWINGGAALTVLTATRTFSNTGIDIVALASPATFDIFGDFDVVDYDFTTDVAQITSPTAQFFNVFDQVLDTSGGSLIITQAGSAPGTFQATIGVAAIPLPPTLLLSLAALGLLSVASRSTRQGG
ncbi:MAG: hypothetical protein AAGH74_01660 [Pseudomonadota bacterium]